MIEVSTTPRSNVPSDPPAHHLRRRRPHDQTLANERDQGVGARVVSCGEDKTVHVWDLAKCTAIQTFRCENNRFWVLASHPNFNLFAAGYDSGLKLKRERQVFAVHQNSLYFIRDNFGSAYVPPRTFSFNPAERAVLVTSSSDNRLYELKALPQQAQGKLKDSSVDGKKGAGQSAIFVPWHGTDLRFCRRLYRFTSRSRILPTQSSRPSSSLFKRTRSKQLAAPEMVFQLTRFRGTNFQEEEPRVVNPRRDQLAAFWLLGVSEVTVQGMPLKLATRNDTLAAIDTRTKLIGGPTTNVENLWAQVKGAAKIPSMPVGSSSSVPWNTTINISMVFGGKLWPITPQDMNLGSGNGSLMFLGGIFDLTQRSSIEANGGNCGGYVLENRVLGVQGEPRLNRVRRAVGSGGVVWFARRGREVERLRDDGGAGDGNGNFM
ncbi:hypothetical protein DFH08DRAFT_996080 [Mycena albidolilacea]|uniref:WD40 repeat-like protein n=1 Tax=Mycena albidolilacea TaxID=1033008 RepID=A0AAD6YXG8_9AGAR|nr:hypothetical protein DFH08DRAFT_996080 [Mycena albidolilacea]